MTHILSKFILAYTLIFPMESCFFSLPRPFLSDLGEFVAFPDNFLAGLSFGLKLTLPGSFLAGLSLALEVAVGLQGTAAGADLVRASLEGVAQWVGVDVGVVGCSSGIVLVFSWIDLEGYIMLFYKF